MSVYVQFFLVESLEMLDDSGGGRRQRVPSESSLAANVDEQFDLDQIMLLTECGDVHPTQQQQQQHSQLAASASSSVLNKATKREALKSTNRKCTLV